jgi:hypothetical protein
MSRIRADKVTDRAGTGPVSLTYGADIAGVTTAAHLNVTGVTTATTFKVGTSLTITASGVNVPTGVVTASSFEGSGANLTSLPEGGMGLLKTILFS